MYYFYTFLCDRRTCSPWVNSCQIYTSEATVLYGNHTHTHTHTLHRCSCWSPVTTVSAKPKGTTRSSSLLHARNGQRLRWGRTAKGTAFSKYIRSHYTTYRNIQATAYTSPTREAQRVVYWHIFETTRSHMSALSLSHHEADKCKDNPVHPAPEPT